MEYPTTGRRRQRSGAVSVAELVERTHPVEPPKVVEPRQHSEPTKHAAPPASTILAADAPPEAPDIAERGSSTFAKVCRTAGLAVGVLAVAASVTAAWAINKNETHPAAAPQPRYEITGADALRPDALAAHLGDQRLAPVPQQQAPGTKPTASDGQADLDQAPAPESKPQDQHNSPQSAAPGRTMSAEAAPEGVSPSTLIRRFYRLLAEDPGKAAALLDPSLLGSDRAAFVQAWSEMRQLRVEQVVEHSDGTVTAVIRMLERDGTWLRVRQLFSTTEGDLPLIGDVRLLSAQRG